MTVQIEPKMTPGETCRVMGLPDAKDLNDAGVSGLYKHTTTAFGAGDPAALMKDGKKD